MDRRLIALLASIVVLVLLSLSTLSPIAQGVKLPDSSLMRMKKDQSITAHFAPFAFPPGPADDNTTSLGSFRIVVDPAFRALLAGYPGYDGIARLQSPHLFDANTVIGRSAPHLHGDEADTGGTAVGTAGTIIADNTFSLIPSGFQGPTNTREVHTEVRSLNMTASSNSEFCVGPPGLAVRSGVFAPDRPISPGEVESRNTGDDFPAESFFNVFVEVDLPAFASFPGGTLFNRDPLLVANANLDALPPHVVYIHENSSAVAVLFKFADPGGKWQAGDRFGWLVLVGHGVDFDCSPTSVQEFEAILQQVSPMQVVTPTIEIDRFATTQALVGIKMPDGSLRNVILNGPATMEVDLASLGDGNNNGKEQVDTELVRMELTGSGMTLRAGRDFGLRASTGQIEEKANINMGRLDLPGPDAPFCTPPVPAACLNTHANSFFAVFLEIEIPSSGKLHPQDALRTVATIDQMPPKTRYLYVITQPIELFNEHGQPAGIFLMTAEHNTDPTVGDVPTVQFSSATYSANESASTTTIIVTLSTVPVSTVTVNYATSNGTATAGSDYTTTSGTLTFNPGETNKTFIVGIIEDAIDESDETVLLAVSNPSNASLGTLASATLTIVDNDASPPTCYTLTASVNPSNGGAVSSTPAPNCQANKYTQGTVVSLSAAANAGYAFGQWSGSASGSANPLSVTMDADKNITANFNQLPHENGREWAIAYGGSGDDSGYSIVQTSDGGFVVAGSTQSFGGDIWVLKLTGNGAIEWQKTYGGDIYGEARSVIETRDGGYIVTVDGGRILKLDRNGAIEWQKAYGGTYVDNFRSIQQTSDEGYIVAGDTGSFVSPAPGQDIDTWVLKLGNDGTIAWQKSYELDGYIDGAYSIQETSDGGFVLSGSSGGLDGFVLKLLNDGTVEWLTSYGSTDGYSIDYGLGASIAEVSNGGFIVAGSTVNFGVGGSDAWILKLRSNGTIEWQKTYGGSGDDAAYSLVETSDGGFLVTGSSDSFGAGQSDAWVFKLHSDGALEWNKTYGGNNEDSFRTVVKTNDGGFVAVGSTQSFGAGGSDVWVLKLDSSGNIADCDIILQSNAATTDTAAQVSSGPSGVGTISSAVPVNTNALVQESSGQATTACSGPSLPIADFTANPTSGPKPLTVNFTDQSTGNITGWSWDFGDGSTNTQQHPIHIYTTAGNYTVLLTVSGPGGSDTETKTNYITVAESQTATVCGQVVWGTRCTGNFFDPIFIRCDSNTPSLWQPLSFTPNAFYNVFDASFETMAPLCTREYGNVTSRLAAWSRYEQVSSCDNICKPQPHSISGRVTDSNGNPISGVTISDGAGHTTTTNKNGEYMLGVPAGTYTITPRKDGYTFSPSSIPNITVPPDATGKDFIATSTLQAVQVTAVRTSADLVEMGQVYFVTVTVHNPNNIKLSGNILLQETGANLDFQDQDFGQQSIFITLQQNETRDIQFGPFQHRWNWLGELSIYDCRTVQHVILNLLLNALGNISNVVKYIVDGGSIIEIAVDASMVLSVNFYRYEAFAQFGSEAGPSKIDTITVEVPWHKQKQLLGHFGLDLLWPYFTGLGITVAGGPDPTDLAFFALEAITWNSACEAIENAADPDPNYRIIAEMEPIVIPAIDAIPEHPHKQAVYDSLTFLSALRALNTSLARYEGAKEANDTVWMEAQLRAARRHTYNVLSALHAIQESTTALLHEVRGQNLQMSAAEVDQVVDFLQVNGLPQIERQVLLELGYDQTTIDTLPSTLITYLEHGDDWPNYIAPTAALIPNYQAMLGGFRIPKTIYLPLINKQ